MDKQKILRSVRGNGKTIPLPKPFDQSVKCDQASLAKFFKAMWFQVGGNAYTVDGERDLRLFIRKHFSAAVDFRKPETLQLFSPDHPKSQLAQLKSVIVEGQFGVRENAAIWVDETSFPHRLIPFICEELILCLRSGQLVHDMHEAYARIGKEMTGFGAFISGPSKTADIEQSLVYGAHGPKQTHVILY